MTEEQTFVRTFEAELGGDGRTVIGRCVPYDTPATVADPPGFEPYQELFRAGAFKAATRAANRVLLDFEHETGIGGVLGHGLELEERPDGLHGRFRVMDHPDGDKALTMVRDKVLTGFSVAFRSRRQLGTPRAGRVERIKVDLDRVSLCRTPAYQDAQVFAVRRREPARRPRLVFDAGLATRLGRLGVQVPQGMLLERLDDDDLATLGKMLQLGNTYIEEQDEPDDQTNIPVMKQALALISSLVPVEAAEAEPDEPEDDE